MGQDRQHNMTHGMGHVGFSRDCPLCPEGTMGQDRQLNMTRGMGHVGYSRDCPLCTEGTMGQDRQYNMTHAWHGTRGIFQGLSLMSYKGTMGQDLI